MRERLQDLAAHLHPHQESVPVQQVQGAVDEALEQESVTGLRERLEMQAVELDTAHPKLGALLRGLVDELSAMGI